MSYSHPAGLLATYNSLTDKHLAGYFNNTRIRRHLLRSGLITRGGRILSEKEYKVNTMKQDHQKYIRECLAQAIFHKVLDMERHHQLEIKRKLDTLAKKERIQRLKGEHTRRFIEDNMPILTPRPPAGPKTNRGHSILAEEGRSSPLTLTAPRPYTAPGNMQPPIRLQPLLSNRNARDGSKRTSGSKPKASLLEGEAPFPIGGKKAMMKFRSSVYNSRREDSYQLPIINSYPTPVPPTPQLPAGGTCRENRLEPWRRRKLRPITAPNALEPLFSKDPGRIYKAAPHSNAVITMVYFGKNVHLSYDDTDFRDEIKIYQQHCGGENLCVYKGKLLEKGTFQFISKRHHGFPFSLTFFLNGIQVNRLSSCCEYKHRKSSRLGGKRGYFGFVCVEKASPCYRCIIAMGLDRKPSLIKPKKEKTIEKKEEPPKKSLGKPRKDRENVLSKRNEMGWKEISASAVCSIEELESGVKEVRTVIEEMGWKGKPGQDAWEEDQENTVKYEYEEDFEAEEEKQDERADEQSLAEDQMSTTSKSPSEGEYDNLIPEQEIETSSEQALDAHASGDHEEEGCLDSDEEKQDDKTVSSISSRSHPYSSDSENEFAEVCVEAHSGHSAGSSQSSSSLDLQENDDQGKPRCAVEDSLETETKEQETAKADVDDAPLLTEVSCTHPTEEEPVKETQEFIESETGEFGQPASPEAESHLQEGGGVPTAEDTKAGLLVVEEDVGQIAGEAQAPGHSRSNTSAGLSITEDGATPRRKPEVNLGRVVEGRTTISSNEQPTQATQEVCRAKGEDTERDASPRAEDGESCEGLREKAEMEEDGALHLQDAEVDVGLREKAGMEEDGALHPQDADVDVGLREKAGMEEDGAHHPQDAALDLGLREKAGIADVPLAGRSPTRQQSPLRKESTEKRERPLSIASEAEASTGGSDRHGEESSIPTGRVAEGHSVFLSVEPTLDRQRDVDPTRPTSLQTVVEKGSAVSEGEQGLEEALLTDSTKVITENPGQAACLKEAGSSEVEEAEREMGCPKPDVGQGKEGAHTELGVVRSMEDAAPDIEDSSEEPITRGEKAATEREEVLEIKVPLSSSVEETWEKPREVVQGNPLDKTDTAREGVTADPEFTLEQDLPVGLPGGLAAAGGREKAERPPTPPRETGSEREEVTGAKVLTIEDLLEEQEVKGGKEGTMKGVSFEEEAHTSPDKTEADAEDAEHRVATELCEATRLLEDPPTERTIALFEATPHLEKSLEESEATASEHRGEELLDQESSKALSQPGRGPSHGEEGLLGAPGPESANQPQVPETLPTARGEERSAKELNSHSGLEGLGEDGALQMQGGGTMIVTQGNLPEERLTTAGVCSGGAEGEKPQGEGDEERECPPGTVTAALTGQNWAVGGSAIKAEEDLPERRVEETAAEQREVLAESKSADEDAVAPSSADGQKKTWDRAGEAPGGTAAEERAEAEDMAPRAEKVAEVEAQQGQAPELQESRPGEDRDRGDVKASQDAGAAGEEAGTRQLHDGHQSGANEDFRGSVSQRESELSRVCPEATPSRKLEFSRTHKKHREELQGESESADVLVNTTE
ncbi:glutamate-rich protein 3 [Acomys russatus]|uniref:glutamate-rich protein 3 n=1 Tax=Acomys russatus TaxID=60746 RepID=UPI0021E2F759|nr:glutamate-rich protein 3 [Acomys russatus]